MSETKSDILQSLLLIISIIIIIYPFILNLNQTIKILGTILGLLGTWSYLQFLFKDWITEQVLESKKMEIIKKDIEDKNQNIKEEIQYIKGWMNATNHLTKNKKGYIDPITLIIVIIAIILIILITQGKI